MYIKILPGIYFFIQYLCEVNTVNHHVTQKPRKYVLANILHKERLKTQANTEICQISSKPIPAQGERLSVTLNADKEEMENGGQIDPFTAC